MVSRGQDPFSRILHPVDDEIHWHTAHGQNLWKICAIPASWLPLLYHEEQIECIPRTSDSKQLWGTNRNHHSYHLRYQCSIYIYKCSSFWCRNVIDKISHLSTESLQWLGPGNPTAQASTNASQKWDRKLRRLFGKWEGVVVRDCSSSELNGP